MTRSTEMVDMRCNMLAKVWYRVPEWRLGQMMCNLLGAYYSITKRDPFFAEDLEFVEFCERYLNGEFEEKE